MSPKVSEAHKDSKRAEIVEAAKRVFIRKGYQAATMKDVVEESGMSRGGVYLYFSSTEDMMLEIVAESEEEDEQWVRTALESGGSVWESLKELFYRVEQEAERISETMIPATIEFFVIARQSGKFAGLMQQRYERAVRLLGELVKRGVETGEFRPVVPAEAASRAIIGFSDSLMIGAAQVGYEAAATHMQTGTVLISLEHLLQVQKLGSGTKGERSE
ncbi:TetR/AcrR family transcriptional regulator [Paenibacillus humicola]|uniref:TetR/AcrR family transcriptional regulator n=1 Tax=Paenibacillus humicola TaxID=3110540 RepID=UPI00237B09B9|nr:TetR family transcriptional regulator [Paenibacillus humicola]